MEGVSIPKVYYSNRCSICAGLLKELNVELKGPFNIAARDEAGIPRDWYMQEITSFRTQLNIINITNLMSCCLTSCV